MLIGALCTTAQTTENATYFPYPQAPDNLPSFRSRANYIVEHFWDRCNFNSAFSSRTKMHKAFSDFAGFLPHAASDTVHTAIDKLIASVKKRPADMQTLLEFAESTFYADTAQFWSEELYLPFAKAAGSTKKMPADKRKHYATQVQIMENSGLHKTIPSLSVTMRDGSTSSLDSINAPVSIILFDTEGCSACSMTRARLAASYSARRLWQEGTIKIACIHVGPATTEWKESVQSLPAEWFVAACPQADKYFDMRVTPAMYKLNQERAITDKYFDINGLLRLFDSVTM